MTEVKIKGAIVGITPIYRETTKISDDMQSLGLRITPIYRETTIQEKLEKVLVRITPIYRETTEPINTETAPIEKNNPYIQGNNCLTAKKMCECKKNNPYIQGNNYLASIFYCLGLE